MADRPEPGPHFDASPCCTGPRRITVSDCFDRGLSRSRGRWLPTSGETCTDENGLEMQFGLEVTDGIVRGVIFKASTCVTLVAYSELLSEWITQMPLKQAVRLTPADLIAALRGVPPGKQNRAVLPIKALQSAIKRAAVADPSRSEGEP